MLIREVAQGPPVAASYRLSERGLALLPVLSDLMAWAREHL